MRRVAALVVAGALLVPSAALADGPLEVRIDDLQATIRDQQTRIETTESRTERSIAMPSGVLFAFDSARLSHAGIRALRAVAADLPAGRVGAITVTGHTDARGSDRYNRALSLRRANAVARALRAADPSLRVRVLGAGESKPVASNRRAAGRARNRRVEVSVGRG